MTIGPDPSLADCFSGSRAGSTAEVGYIGVEEDRSGAVNSRRRGLIRLGEGISWRVKL